MVPLEHPGEADGIAKKNELLGWQANAGTFVALHFTDQVLIKP